MWRRRATCSGSSSGRAAVLGERHRRLRGKPGQSSIALHRQAEGLRAHRPRACAPSCSRRSDRFVVHSPGHGLRARQGVRGEAVFPGWRRVELPVIGDGTKPAAAGPRRRRGPCARAPDDAEPGAADSRTRGSSPTARPRRSASCSSSGQAARWSDRGPCRAGSPPSSRAALPPGRSRATCRAIRRHWSLRASRSVSPPSRPGCPPASRA